MARGRDGRATTTPGCARARAATAISTTAIASITWSACIACTSGRSTRRLRRSSIPPSEPSQIALGETLIEIFAGAESRPELIAEDLGSIPPFVRESMERLDLPGLKVLRWERHWDREGQPPIDPRDFPERSVATTGTHDIEPLAATPEGATEESARGDSAVAVVRRLVPDVDSAAGCVRLDRSHQYAGGGGRCELDVAVAVAGRYLAGSRRDRGAGGSVEGMDAGGRPLSDSEQPHEPQEPKVRSRRRRSMAPPAG